MDWVWRKVKDDPPPQDTWINISRYENGCRGTGVYFDNHWIFKDDYSSWEPPKYWMPMEGSE